MSEVERALISPKGDRIAVTMRVEGKVILKVFTLPGLQSIGTFGLHSNLDIHDVYWSSNDRLLFGASYRMGKGDAKVITSDLMAVNVDGSAFRTLIGGNQQNLFYIESNRRDWEIVDLLDDEDDRVLISSYDTMSGSHPSLYRLNTSQGKAQRLFQSRYRFGEFMTDHSGKVRFQGGTERDGTYVLLHRASEAATWEEIGRYDTIGSTSLIPLGFAPDNKRIYVADSNGKDTAELYLFDPVRPGQRERLFKHETYDFEGLLPGRTKGEPIGVILEGERNEWRYFEPHHPDVALFDAIRKAFGGRNVSLVNMSQDRAKAVFFVDSDVDPGNYYVLDLARRATITRIAVRPWIKPAEMIPTKPIELKARDGLTLHGYLTAPVHPDKQTKKMVVMVHGGPMGVRDYWGFDSEVQWLAANGYSVLQVNFRGSGGYGGAFENAGYGEWGAKMQDDVTDATRWAIENGFADKNSICIYGASYGAYSAMMGLIREPDLYRCGVGYAGVYDLEAWQKDSMAASTPEGRAYQRAAVGKDSQQLHAMSPAWRASEIKAPVLLVHGGEDLRAPIEQFERMKASLDKANKRVETLVKKKEEHGFISEANVAEFYERIVRFLDASTASTE